MAGHNVILRDERGVEYDVAVTPDGSVTVGTRTMTVVKSHPGELRVAERTVWAATDGDLRWVFVDGQVYTFELRRTGGGDTANARRAGIRKRRAAGQEEGLSAPMPATVLKILARVGAHAKAGDVLIILEAMKMELPVRTSLDGTVTAVRCREGELVQPGEALVLLEPSTAEPHAAAGITALRDGDGNR